MISVINLNKPNGQDDLKEYYVFKGCNYFGCCPFFITFALMVIITNMTIMAVMAIMPKMHVMAVLALMTAISVLYCEGCNIYKFFYIGCYGNICSYEQISCNCHKSCNGHQQL